MPGAVGYGWHESNRGEYLAQYFLTALGVSAPVIRQEDVGIDFYCALARNENKRLTFHSPFMVQHGSAASKNFVYGGYSDKGKWREAAVEWLFSQELPLFLCTTDLEAARFRLYSTSSMWLARYQFGFMNTAELCPDERHNPIEKVRSENPIGPVTDGGGYGFRIPLGGPIVDLNVFDLEKEKRQAAIETLRRAINVEQVNITFRRLGVHTASWCHKAVPNEPDSIDDIADALFWNPTPGQNVGAQIVSLKHIAVTLALNLDAQNATEQLAHLAPVFKLFRKDSIQSWVIPQLPKIVVDNLE